MLRPIYSLEERMDRPRIFLGSSGKQAKLLQALTRGLGLSRSVMGVTRHQPRT